MYLPDSGRRVVGLKKLVCGIFDALCGPETYTLKLHLLHHFVQYMSRLGISRAVNSLPLEAYDVHIKTPCRLTLERRSSVMEEMVREMKRQSTPESRREHGRTLWSQSTLDIKQATLENGWLYLARKDR